MILKNTLFIKYFLTAVILIAVCSEELYAVDPAFQLSLTNRTYTSSNEGYFDVVLKHTNFYQTDFHYAGGIYVISLDTFFLADHLNYIFSKDTATYGSERIPLQYVGSLTKVNDILKLDSGQAILPGDQPVISHTGGTMIARIRFYNPDLYSGSCLIEEQFSWKTSMSGDYTKIFASIYGVKTQLNNSLNNFSTYDLCPGFTCCLSAPLPPPVRISPVNNSVNISSSVTLLWQRGFPVNYFAQLQVAEDSIFNSIVREENITAPNGTEDISVTLSDLFPGTYYWRVKQGGIPPAGAYNEAWKFTIIPAPLTLKIKAVPECLLGTLSFAPFHITAYLRNADSPFELIDSSEISSSDSAFSNTFTFNNAPSGRYYIVYKKANCIETYSRAGGDTLIRGSIENYYDFTSSESQAFGNNLFFADSIYCIFSGDVDQDGEINLADVIIVSDNSNEFHSGDFPSDLNGDGITDLKDLMFTYNNSNKPVTSVTPLNNALIVLSQM